MNNIIEVKNLTKVYQDAGKRVTALKNIRLQLKPAAFVAIAGPSGAGKSTLIHIMGSLDSPSFGEVLFKGKNLAGLTSKEKAVFRNQRIGFVFQSYHLIPELTVYENVFISCLIGKVSKKTARDRTQSLIKKLGLQNRINFYPGQISGGEQQRCAIARALVNKPEILFCDEPTGNLDKESSENIKNLLVDINKSGSTTIVLVTHNLELANSAQKVLNIKDGCLV